MPRAQRGGGSPGKEDGAKAPEACPEGSPVVERPDPLKGEGAKRGPGRPAGSKNRSHKKKPEPTSPEDLAKVEAGIIGLLNSFVGIRKGEAPARDGGILYEGEAKMIAYSGARVMDEHADAGFIGRHMHEMLLGATVLSILVRELVAMFKAPPALPLADAGPPEEPKP